MYTLSHKLVSKVASGTDREVSEYSALEELLDSLAAGILLTDSHGRVLYLNHAAKRLIDAGDPLRVVNQFLKPRDAALRGPLVDAISKPWNSALDSRSRLRSIALPSASTSGIVATILSLNPSKNLNLKSEATAVVFLEAPIEKTHLPSEAFAKLYGLTGSELRLLISISLSCSIDNAAASMGIKTCTAKTHLQHIYQKTNTTKLSELLSLFTHSVLRHELTRIGVDDATVD